MKTTKIKTPPSLILIEDEKDLIVGEQYLSKSNLGAFDLLYCVVNPESGAKHLFGWTMTDFEVVYHVKCS